MIEQRGGNEENLSIRLMTEETYNILIERMGEIGKKLKELGAKSEGGHQRAAIHDDVGTEHEKNKLRAELAMIGDLSSVDIIKPPAEVALVSIGAQVGLEYSDGEMIKALLLGPDDAITLQDRTVISYKSPLGNAILGKSVGEEVEIKIKSNLLKVKIIDISKGEF